MRIPEEELVMMSHFIPNEVVIKEDDMGKGIAHLPHGYSWLIVEITIANLGDEKTKVSASDLEIECPSVRRKAIFSDPKGAWISDSLEILAGESKMKAIFLVKDSEDTTVKLYFKNTLIDDIDTGTELQL